MRSWCFDSQVNTAGGVTTFDREYGTKEIREVMGKIIGNGVYANPATNMQVIADSGLSIKVKTGCCWISGAFGVIDADESLPIDLSAKGRTDLIVARFDLSTAKRSIYITVLKGTEGTNIGATLMGSASIHDIQLAKINVRAGATSVLQSDITDTRYNSTVCGIVTGVIDQIDTTNLFAQFQASFNAFMDSLKNTLSGDVAGNLLNLINTHKSDKGNPHAVTKSQVGLGNLDNIRQYSLSNRPPYPVEKVCGKTGEVNIKAADIGAAAVDFRIICGDELTGNVPYPVQLSGDPKFVIADVNFIDNGGCRIIERNGVGIIYKDAHSSTVVEYCGSGRVTVKDSAGYPNPQMRIYIIAVY
ncbi:MAG: hypothetical protein RSC99_08650 [Clostridiales bacterium]